MAEKNKTQKADIDNDDVSAGEDHENIHAKPLDPQRNLFPATDKELSDIISTEANYDRWQNFVFPHTRSGDLFERRKHTWTVNLPDGQPAKAHIEIIPAKEERCYTSRSYDVFLALISLWRKHGSPDEIMEIYLTDIATELKLPKNGRNIDMIYEELKCLYFTVISWVFSFTSNEIDSDTLQHARILETFDYQRISERSSGRKGARIKASIRLSQHIRDNLRNQVTAPVNFAARKAIKSDIAKTVYSRVDSILATNPRYERTASNMLIDYNITAKRYTRKSSRMELLEMIQKNIDGKETSRRGVFISMQVTETNDGSDWKAIFSTRGSVNKKSKPSYSIPVVNTDNRTIEYLIDEIVNVVGNRTENYGLYKTFAKHYSEDMIFRALGEYKELTLINKKISNKQSYFTSLMHTIAHKMGVEWIKECDSQCRYRPENQLGFE